MTITKPKFNPERAVYTPAEVLKYGDAAIKSIKERSRRAIGLGIPLIDDYFAPALPGELVAIIAQTSNYKSGFMHAIERAAAEQIDRENRPEILIHVSVEESVEQQAFYLLARESGEDAGKLAQGIVQDWKKLEQAKIKVGAIDIYRIGESLARAEDFPHLSVSNMIRSIQAIANGDITGKPMKVGGLFFDYLQAFPIDEDLAKLGQLETQRRLQVKADIFRLRQAAAYYDCPVFVAVQAKQTLTGCRQGDSIQMPGIYDGEETSSIAQRADRIIQLAMPKMTNTINSQIQVGDRQITVTDDLLYVKIGKQRGGLPSGRTYQTRVNFNKNIITVDVL